MRALSGDQVTALRYVCDHPGCTTAGVAKGTGLPHKHAQRSLEALYTKRLLGRQHNMLGLKAALWFPEADALARLLQEVKP